MRRALRAAIGHQFLSRELSETRGLKVVQKEAWGMKIVCSCLLFSKGGTHASSSRIDVILCGHTIKKRFVYSDKKHAIIHGYFLNDPAIDLENQLPLN